LNKIAEPSSILLLYWRFTPGLERRLQRDQSLGTEFHPWLTGRTGGKRSAYSGGVTCRDGDRNWGHSGVTLDSLPAGSVMTTENLVDAALAGLDQGELVTIPPVEDLTLWQRWEEARLALFNASRNGTPASRYPLA
jgi:hypothetical protein